MEIAYENLKLIPKLFDEIALLKDEIKELKFEKENLDLTKPTHVAKYLGMAQKTLYNCIEDGRFKKNVHYTKVLKGDDTRIVFIESAIINRKKNDFL